jgi:uncharacterized protein
MNFRDDKLHIDWMDVDALCLDMANDARQLGITKVVGITRGGLIPGVIMSHLLNVPFEAVTWQTRDGLIQDVEAIVDNNFSTTLFVDDICDSGITMEDVARLAPDAKRAVMLNKRRDMGIDIVGTELYNVEEWVVHPWESEE